jgi:large subunit ribosomal protein L16
MNIYLPKKTKYKIFQKMTYRLKGLTSGLYLIFHKIGFFLKSLNSKKVNSNQIESSRRVIRRLVKKQGIIEIFLNFDQTLTEKSSGVRMGKGKGAIQQWISNVNVARNFLFITNLNYLQSKFVLLKAKKKLSFKTSIHHNLDIKKKFIN